MPSEVGPLEIAARQGNTGLVQMLLREGAQIDASDANSEDNEYSDGCAYTALQIAAFWGHVAVVECLLSNGADVNAVRQTLGTPLQAALEGGRFEVAELLLARGAEIDKHWGVFGSCLQVFCERDSLEVAEFLLRHGANIEDGGGHNGNALQVTCDAGHVDLVQFLLDSGAQVDAPGRENGNALVATSASGHVAVVERLLSHATQRGEAISDVSLALHRAAAGGHSQVVRVLLQNSPTSGAAEAVHGHGKGDEHKSNSEDEHRGLGGNALLSAAYYGHEDTVSVLLESGVDVHAQGKLPFLSSGSYEEWRYRGRTGDALFAACFRGFASIAKILFLRDPHGYTEQQTFAPALEVSVGCQRSDVSAMLVRESIDAGFEPSLFGPVVHFACHFGHVAFVDQILESLLVSNWPASLGQAVAEGQSAVVAILLKHGADPSLADENGNSPLALALTTLEASEEKWYGHDPPDTVGVVGVLIEAGASLDGLTSEIRTVVPMIAKSGRVDVLETIKNHGCSLFAGAEDHVNALLEASRAGQVDMVRYLSQEGELTASNIEEAILATLKECRGCDERDSRDEDVARILRDLQSQNCAGVLRILLGLDAALFFAQGGPLPIASQKGLAEAVRLLLTRARQSMATIEDSFRAAVEGRHVECAQAILELESDRIDRLQMCTRAIPLSLPRRSAKMLRCLLGHGVSPDSRDENGESLLYIAAKHGDGDAVEVLLRHGADAALESGEHGTALHAAAIRGSAQVAEMLLDADAPVDAQSGSCRTPLMAAMAQKWEQCWAVLGMRDLIVLGCHRCCVQVLLDFGADVDAESPSFGTALHVATKAGNMEGVKMLLERGATGSKEAGETGAA